jgi:crotonobetainyl-CoA:carnitine CoA-transferase CaiB-like acyl-CoA transferase
MDFLAGEFAKRTLAEWDAYLRTLDVCYGRVNTLPEALAHENLHVAGLLPRDELGRTHVGPPIRFRHEPALPVLREPAHGEHTAQVLGSPAHDPLIPAQAGIQGQIRRSEHVALGSRLRGDERD